jgi:hypothetical protein
MSGSQGGRWLSYVMLHRIIIALMLEAGSVSETPMNICLPGARLNSRQDSHQLYRYFIQYFWICCVYQCNWQVSSRLSLHGSCYNMATFSDLRVPRVDLLWYPNRARACVSSRDAGCVFTCFFFSRYLECSGSSTVIVLGTHSVLISVH